MTRRNKQKALDARSVSFLRLTHDGFEGRLVGVVDQVNEGKKPVMPEYDTFYALRRCGRSQALDDSPKARA